ncbi:hypothetical protein JN531_007440 [Flagellatimonas centrodinii]|uniref:AbrB/MazE/SpoVT family DNA-binding domain-containing protein n=1 Tax=Flagellatimonas centrodinii TaxID=2806210 RepID=UPI001FEE2E1A|nr:AbrB/MazE/SpoVT family DNA-binding domain-containing protein [Flagellatimonas centrodinii]ULQ48123.1 hypothetical protein JN531_007440 [Flagellatimonas centrodinii]
MQYSTKIRKVGSSCGVILSKEVMTAMNVKEGDVLYLTEAPGGFKVGQYDDTFARQMAVAEEVMHEHRDVLKALASR